MDATSLNKRIAARVRELRDAQNLSLEALAKTTGVSRSMISLIERAECSPTAVVLEKLSVGLGVVLASFFDVPTNEQASRSPLARAKDQPLWRDPESGYIRRNVSPAGPPRAGQIVEVEFPAGVRVVFDSSARNTVIHQQVWVLEGSMEIGVGDERHRLQPGDCLLMQHNKPILFHNPTHKTARYAVVTVPEAEGKRSKR
ncbi:MAG: helix-turn-helix domain-containing protein [Opitutaceae bacterium]|nr:helix-turn-helix domain-containing protein [Opitutaceae bacterium]